MASIVKKPTRTSKGIVVFTHKERFLLDERISELDEQLQRLKEAYVVGMHWGIYQSNIDPVPYVDFHLARPNTVSFTDEDEIRRIPLASYNFIPERFREMNLGKNWDLITVAHPTRRKRNYELLKVIRRMYDDGNKIDVLFICGKAPSNKGPNWDYEFFERYETDFTQEEQRHIEIATPVRDEDLFPIPNSLFPYFYNASTVSALFSRVEGNPKVLHEALLCGTPVMVRSDLKGAGMDYLTENNAEIVDDLTEAKKVLTDMVTNSQRYNFDSEELRKRICVSHTAEKLEVAIRSVFDELGEPFEGELRTRDLWKKLPSHDINAVPREFCYEYTSDLKSRPALYNFVDWLLDKYTSPMEKRKVQLESAKYWSQEQAPNWCMKKIRRTIWEVDRHTRLPVYETVSRAYNTVVTKEN
jgi:glycosyltransferase involved in cell wall biosynthesis